jgi:RNA polymerase sporulation-specific sigma factor
MPKAQNKSASVKTLEKENVDPEVLYYIKLVEKTRKSKKQEDVNEAFQLIVDGLSPKIKKIAGKFRIAGYSFDDIYQEALYALRYKAIKDYDSTRGSGEGPAAFDRFALLCIRRHLATTLKASHQNRHKVLGSYRSLDQDRSSDNDELSLSSIIPSPDGDVLGKLQNKEEFATLVNKLLSRLSKFEKQVFFLYAQQYTYEEISDIINRKFPQRSDVNVKGVDNALSRIKNKAKVIVKRHDAKATKAVDNALERIKRKAHDIDSEPIESDPEDAADFFDED